MLEIKVNGQLVGTGHELTSTEVVEKAINFVLTKLPPTEHEQVLGLMQEIITREKVKQKRAIEDLALSVMEEAKGEA